MTSGRIAIVGHRGAAGVVPENTLKGFRYAIDLGVDCVECDVHLTRDSHLVVMHDETVDRTTNGSGSIHEIDVAAIRALDAGDGEQVPTLDEVLAVVQGKVQLLCELKGEGVEEATVETVVARGMEREVVFTSFDMRRIAKVKGLGDHLLTGAILVDPEDEEIKRVVDTGVVGIGVYYKNLCLRAVERALDAGIDIRAWNPDTLREQQAMIALGVNGVSTNRPDILIEYLHSFMT